MEINSKTVQLETPHIFNFGECLHFLDRGYDDCLYTIKDESVLKPLHIDGERGLIKVFLESNSLNVVRVSGEVNLAEAARYVTEWFDLARDLQPFYQLLDRHEQLSWMTTRYHGLRLMGIPNLFEALCWCVIGQQINLTFAYRLKRRMVETYGSFLTYNDQKHFCFPEPEVLADVSVKELKEMQFSRRKAEYIIGIAQKFMEGTLSKAAISKLSGSEQMLKRLTQIRGVGPWTANYTLMKALQQMDCITYGDTGLQSAISSMLGLDRKPEKKETQAFFEPFIGWESYLNIYLWRTLSSKNGDK